MHIVFCTLLMANKLSVNTQQKLELKKPVTRQFQLLTETNN